MECGTGKATRKQILRVQNETIELKFLNWVYDMWEKEVYICDCKIKEKARRISAELYGDSVPTFTGLNLLRGGFIVLESEINLNDIAYIARLVRRIGKEQKGNPLGCEKLFNFTVRRTYI